MYLRPKTLKLQTVYRFAINWSKSAFSALMKKFIFFIMITIMIMILVSRQIIILGFHIIAIYTISSVQLSLYMHHTKVDKTSWTYRSHNKKS